jgi:regulator of RNase E activity RraA
MHGDQHGVLTIPEEIADRVPDAAAGVEADERTIIEACRSPDFSPERLKGVYQRVRPGTY